MWKKLLVPHDFSPCAARALNVAAALARVHGAELVLVHVSELPENLPPDTLVTPADAAGPVRVDQYTMRGAWHQLELLAEPLRREGLAVTSLAVTGSVAKQILTRVGEVGADAIVIGTHGRTGLSAILLGSVAEKVVRGASVPVVSVRTHGPEAERTREEATAEDELVG